MARPCQRFRIMTAPCLRARNALALAVQAAGAAGSIYGLEGEGRLVHVCGWGWNSYSGL